MASEWSKAILKASESIDDFSDFYVTFWDETDFTDFIDRMKYHIETYRYLWFVGHFDNSFVKKIEPHYNEARKKLINIRVLSLPFRQDARGRANKRTLEKLQRIGAEVKINEHLHGRMMMLLPEMGTISEIVLGSFDFNKDSLSGDKTNSGIYTKHPDIVSSAKKQFEHVWESEDSLTIAEYTEGWK